MNTTNISKVISDIITEAALDARIPDGVVNLANTDHVQVVAEVMYDNGVNESLVNEFIKKFVDEGKYPDRQAFNREGWLVTFPSKEYRDRAIKKGTHSIADPTHGKGGMNLYYKKKGKQQRQTQQDPSQTTQPDQSPPLPTASAPEPSVDQSTPVQVVPTPQQPQQPNPQSPQPPATGEVKPSDPSGKPTNAQAQPSDSALPPSSDSPAKPESPVDAPTSSTPEPKTSTPEIAPFVKLSKKFAAQKGWVSAPYGEWRDAQGNVMAVVSLSDEVVPVKSVYRDELKLFVDKYMT